MRFPLICCVFQCGLKRVSLSGRSKQQFPKVVGVSVIDLYGDGVGHHGVLGLCNVCLEESATRIMNLPHQMGVFFGIIERCLFLQGHKYPSTITLE